MYPPHHLGGYELVWQSAVADLRESGHEVRVLTSDLRLSGRRGREDPDVHRDLRWYWSDHSWPRLSVRRRFQLERHNANVFDRHLRELRPDVVAWWAMGGMSLSLITRAGRAGLPAVAFVHDDWLIYGPHVDAWLRLLGRPGLRRPELRRLVSRVTSLPTDLETGAVGRWAFVSEHTRQRALTARHPPSSVSTLVLPSGIDASFLKLPMSRPDWGWRLLYVGRIDARKGIDTAVAALARLPVPAMLTVVGDGDERARRALQAQAAELGLDGRVKLVGARPRHELPVLYAAADVLVFPARWEEPWGLVPLEAMALGCPVVTTARGGTGEYLRPGDNCLTIPVDDPDALAAAVTRLSLDFPLRARLREAGLGLAARHVDTEFNQRAQDLLLAMIGASDAVA